MAATLKMCAQTAVTVFSLSCCFCVETAWLQIPQSPVAFRRAGWASVSSHIQVLQVADAVMGKTKISCRTHRSERSTGLESLKTIVRPARMCKENEIEVGESVRGDDSVVALITGASKGIGRAISWEAGWKGHRVVVTCRDAGAGKDLANDMCKEGIEACSWELDVASEERYGEQIC